MLRFDLIDPTENINICNIISFIIPTLLSVINNIIYNYIPNISYRKKNSGTIYFDILIMYILLFLPYKISEYNTNINVFTIFGAISTNIVFIICENTGFDFTLSNRYMWTNQEIFLFFALCFGYVLGILYHRKEFQNMYTYYYFFTILILSGISVIIYLVDNRIKTFHIHHWIVGYSLLFLFRTNKKLCQLQAGIAFGIFIHGTITYGLDDIFT